MELRKNLQFALTLYAGTLAAPANAQTAIAQDQVTAGDVATTPLVDLNIKKTEVPSVLVAARDKPYNLAGLTRCNAITKEVAQLDTVLGDDIDIARDDGGAKISFGRVAKSLVRSLIPFGGVIREVSGAGSHERMWNEAIYAGSVRRAFLKGIGQQRGCKYPARSASTADSRKLWSSRDEAEAAAKEPKPGSAKAKFEPPLEQKPKPATRKTKQKAKAKGKAVQFESRPVVQKVN